MAAVETPVAEHRLTIAELLDWLVADGMVEVPDAEKMKKERRYYRGTQHPLSIIADQKWKSAKPPHKVLALDSLAEWLAKRVNMEYKHIDPLKIDFSAVTDVMSISYATRFHILPLSVNSKEVVIAVCEPYVREWEKELQRINKLEIRRVIANPQDIDRFQAEFYNLAKSMKGAANRVGGQSGLQNFEQLVELGANKTSLRNAVATEIQRFISGREGSTGAPINLVLRAAFNPNLKTAWFSAMTQVINQITLLTVILTGAALIREREQGTVEHLLVMPVVPSEIMLAKMIANGLVILVAAMLSLQFVVHWWIGSPINGSLLVFLLGAAIYALVVAALGILLGTLATTMGQFGLLAMPVLMVTQLLSGSSTPMESMPVWLQYFIQTISPTPHFVQFAQAVLFRGADLTLVWRPLVAMLAIGVVYFAVASVRFRKVIFGG